MNHISAGWRVGCGVRSGRNGDGRGGGGGGGRDGGGEGARGGAGGGGKTDLLTILLDTPAMARTSFLPGPVWVFMGVRVCEPK